MDPRIEQLPEMTVAGIALNPEEAGWDRVAAAFYVLALRALRMEGAIERDWLYGVVYRRQGDGPGIDTYLAGFELADGQPVPDGLDVVTVPAGLYASFTAEGGLGAIGPTYERLNAWRPTSGYREARCGAVEVYDSRFAPAADCQFEVRIAIEKE